MSKVIDFNAEKELITIHHDIVDSVARIVANLFLIDQISKNGSKVFIHNNIRLQINADLITHGLSVNLKDYVIGEYGERDGLSRAYTALKSMYFAGANNNPIALTPIGHETLNNLFITFIESAKDDDYQAANDELTQPLTWH